MPRCLAFDKLIGNTDLFEWIYNQVKEKVPFLQYYKGPDSHKLKRYQMGRAKSQVKLVLIYFKTFTFWSYFFLPVFVYPLKILFVSST